MHWLYKMNIPYLYILAQQISTNSLPGGKANGDTVHTIISITIGITAALSLLFITIGGFRYILSQGDPQSVSKSKSTVIYALVGLVVAIIAQAIVSFVFVRIT